MRTAISTVFAGAAVVALAWAAPGRRGPAGLREPRRQSLQRGDSRRGGRGDPGRADRNGRPRPGRGIHSGRPVRSGHPGDASGCIPGIGCINVPRWSGLADPAVLAGRASDRLRLTEPGRALAVAAPARPPSCRTAWAGGVLGDHRQQRLGSGLAQFHTPLVNESMPQITPR